MNLFSTQSTSRGILLGVASTVLLLLGGHTLLAEGDPNPDWELPGGNIFTTYPHYKKIANVTTLLYGTQYKAMDVNGDGLIDWVYKDPTTEYVYLNNGSGWDVAYSCRFRNDVWIDDCEYRNTPAAAAALSSAEPCTYVAEEGHWEGDCEFVPR